MHLRYPLLVLWGGWVLNFLVFFVQCESQMHYQKANATFPKLD